MERFKAILPILAVNFIGTLGFAVVIPFMVFLVTKWGGNSAVYGLVASAYSFFQLIGAPVLGRWSDEYGRRKILLLSQLGTLISWCMFLLAFFLEPVALFESDTTGFLGQFTLTLPLLLLILARALDGLTGGNVSVANAYLADITDDEHRTQNFGLMAMSANLGIVLGPVLAGILGVTIYAEIIPISIVILISIVGLLIIYFFLHEADPKKIEEHLHEKRAHHFFEHSHKKTYTIHHDTHHMSLGEILAMPHMLVYLSFNFIIMAGFSVFYASFPAHAALGLKWDAFEMGAFFSFISVISILVQGPLLGYVSQHFLDTVLIIGGAIILAIGFILFSIDAGPLIYLSGALFALGNGLMWPTFQAMLSKLADGEIQGRVQGISGSLTAAGTILGMIIGGMLYTEVGTITFWISSTVILIGSSLALFFHSAVKAHGETTSSG